MTGFRLGYVPGVTPAKWARIWTERLPRVPLDLVQTAAADAPDLLRRSEVDAALLRLPIDRTGLHAIPLYVEQTVVVVPKDHVITAADEITPDDLADELTLHPRDDVLDWEHPPGRLITDRPAATADAIQLVAMGTGLLVVPQSLARLHHRKDLTYRPITDVPQSQVALSWPETDPSELVEHFIGIVRGRTANSTRGAAQPQQAKQAKQSSQSSQSRQSAAGSTPKKSQASRKGTRKSTSTPRKPRRR
ncbi:LysR family substrate-binding domain-containing protein [Kribbella sp. NPDC048915]|uniref:LysR family substrate-binding domain-containing protein n=1 Tax=Kribbella sp. NPDC048915 TaxID=3155148 RepID=UPI0033D98BE9